MDTNTAKFEYLSSNNQSCTLLHKKLVGHIKQNTRNIEEVEVYLEIVIKAIENCQRILHYDQRNHPF